jgi:hypothetical protein
MTVAGGVTLPTGKRLEAASLVTYENDVKYTLHFRQL